MAQKTIQIADKPTLDAIKTGVDALAVSNNKKTTTIIKHGILVNANKNTILNCINASGAVKYICIYDVQDGDKYTVLDIKVDNKTTMHIEGRNSARKNYQHYMAVGDISHYNADGILLPTISTYDSYKVAMQYTSSYSEQTMDYTYPQEENSSFKYDQNYASSSIVTIFPIGEINFDSSLEISITGQALSNHRTYYGVIYELHDQ